MGNTPSRSIPPSFPPRSARFPRRADPFKGRRAQLRRSAQERVEDLATHQLALEEAPHAYEIFQRKEEGAIKILLKP